jgi:hypothetical protein
MPGQEELKLISAFNFQFSALFCEPLCLGDLGQPHAQGYKTHAG